MKTTTIRIVQECYIPSHGNGWLGRIVSVGEKLAGSMISSGLAEKVEDTKNGNGCNASKGKKTLKAGRKRRG